MNCTKHYEYFFRRDFQANRKRKQSVFAVNSEVVTLSICKGEGKDVPTIARN